MTIPVEQLRAVLQGLNELPEPARGRLEALAEHYDPATPFPDPAPKSQGFGPLDSDNHKEWLQDRRKWDEGRRPRFQR